ncbi:unsaturated rhamnogalacturonyl hydrolase [Amphibacillus marinus]|uniref:Unsaturated rhamnogalacturonyl hydrolase n=1 Tax=Amphibacillus marinus TaxID=872970 RepID=A0A1H8HAP5_9BACI|nr:glycoside hydrolase family 88 protein [Amphibacillus marinus]SEN53160.1 unsaturated rhamnogalacturonyl hydrolase [Amphibacillus marinus]
MLLKQNKSAIDWAELACQSLMKTYEPNELPPRQRWHYHQGVFLWSMLDLWQVTGKQSYFNYVKGYADGLIDQSGNLLFARGELDAIQAGLILYPLFDETGDHRYLLAASKLRHLYHTLNKTKEGGYWHKDKYPYQMWLDGLYMAGPFMVEFAQRFNEPDLIKDVLLQERLMRKYTKDNQSGLYFHGYDESKAAPWSMEAGHAPEIWGRALGWYVMVLTLFLDLLPEDNEVQAELRPVLSELIDAIMSYRDVETNLWYQVIDKGSDPNNWLESSCSALFIHAIAKSINRNYIDATYKAPILASYASLTDKFVKTSTEQGFTLEGICIGTSIGDYDFYLNRETCANDLHGVGAFVLASTEIAKLAE